MEDHANLSRAVASSQSEFAGLISKSAPMRRLYELIGKMSQSTSSVLLLGETGTGKELVARAIYSTGLRRKKALVSVDCSASATLKRITVYGVRDIPDYIIKQFICIKILNIFFDMGDAPIL